MCARRDRNWEEDDPLDSYGFEGNDRGANDSWAAGEVDLSPLARMSGQSLRRVIERLDKEMLSLALRYADAQVVERVLRNVSVRAAATLREEMEAQAQIEPHACFEAQHVLMETAYSLEERGEISFEGPADDAVPPLEPAIEERLGAFGLPEAVPASLIELLEGMAERAREHGLLSLESALERIPEGILAAGLRMVVDQLPAGDIETVLQRQIDSFVSFLERNAEIRIEGVLSIASGEDAERARARLVSYLPEGEADFERMPEVRLTPSAQSTNDLIRLCCRLAAVSHRGGLGAMEERLEEIPDRLLRRGMEWAMGGFHVDEIERMLDRRTRTYTERERRKLEMLLEGLVLIREGAPPSHIREALEGFLEEMA